MLEVDSGRGGSSGVGADLQSVVVEVGETSAAIGVGAKRAYSEDVGASDEWNTAFAPTPEVKKVETTLDEAGIQEKWHRNKDGRWRGYFVVRSTGIVRSGPTAGQKGKLMNHVGNSRILNRTEPKGTRGGRSSKV